MISTIRGSFASSLAILALAWPTVNAAQPASATQRQPAPLFDNLGHLHHVLDYQL